jgi:glycosyltransferase involved in cell wall biosynthesis
LTPIRVLHPITRLIVGGAQENTMLTAALLDPTRFEVEVLSGPQTGSEGSLIEEVRARGVPLTILPDLLRQVSPLHDLRAFWQMVQLMRKNRYTIVHTHSSKAGILGRLAARAAGVPVIIHTVHGWSFHDYMSPFVRATYIFLERLCAGMTDCMIVVTGRDIEKGQQQNIGKPEQYRLVRSSIQLDEFDPALFDRAAVRQELGIPIDAPVLGNIGRFSSQKNPQAWVRVAMHTAQEVPDLHLLLVGDGPLRSEVAAQLNEAGLANRALLPGLQRDVPRYLAAMDVFLLTSLWEGLPRVIPQAMAMQVPVVAHRVDGSAEAVLDGRTGYLCTPGNLEGLAGRCIQLLQNPGMRAEMGSAGREYALREFDLRQMIGQISGIYMEISNQKGITL